MLKLILKFAVRSVVITLAIALGLVVSNPTTELLPRKSLDFGAALKQDLRDVPATQGVAMRDGYALPVRSYGTSQVDQPLIVMVHGSGWHGMQFDGLAQGLAADAHILVPDLRGHGVDPARRGDINYIGQFEDDLADLIKSRALPDQKVVMLGHSSGGGLVVRFAGGAHGAMIDHAVLLAPYLGHNAPTSRTNSGGWAHVLTRRIIGLSMLNGFGISALNHLPIIQFQFPAAALEGPLGHTVTQAYSYRLNTSYAPRRDYGADIAALPAFSLIVGARDEAFFADEYEPLMSSLTGKGRYLMVPEVTHLPIVDAPETLNSIQEDLRGL